MQSSRHTDATGEVKNDLSALAWVQEELRRSLDNAHKALRRFVKEAESLSGSDVDVVDPSVLRTARAQIHQGVGALELVGLPAAAAVLRAGEAVLQRYAAKPHKLTSAVIDDLEKASFALLDYIARLLAGKPMPPLAMFPQYRAVQEAAGADRVHPADLWGMDWSWRELPQTGEVAPRAADEATRAEMEQLMLALMRGSAPTAALRMSELCESIGRGAVHPQSACLWRLAAAMFEAQAQGLLKPDVFSKRVASRLLAQLRIVERGDSDVSERLAQDVLFFCAQAEAPVDAAQAPRLSAVRRVYGLDAHSPIDYAVAVLGRFDPAWVVQARKRVASAKDSWSAVAGGEMHRMGGLAEQFALVGDSLTRLFPKGEVMAAELQEALARTQQSGEAPSASLAMEVATGLLYVEAALEDADFDTPQQGERVQRLAQRIAGVRQGAAAQPLEGWMEDLYRRVSDRQTMGSVVQELRVSLSEAEKLIDQFFRHPADRNVLIPVPGQLQAMRGVLSVLGMDQASAALLRMRDDVDGFIATEVEPERAAQAGRFERLAGNLGALGFLIDMLSVQPQLAKSLFVFDSVAGTLNPLMGRAAPIVPEPSVDPRLIEQAQMVAEAVARDDVPVEDVARNLENLSQQAQAADQPGLAATVIQAQEALELAQGNPDDIASVRGELTEALADFVATASGTLEFTERSREVAAPVPVPDTAELADDDEMRDVFLEEAREVIQAAREANATLADEPSDLGQITAVRRAFHTLKGSSRMVGLKDFGEAAWACEQLYNARLADQQPADEPLLAFTRQVLDELAAWVEDIAAHRDGHRQPHAIAAAALALREPGAAATPAPVQVVRGPEVQPATAHLQSVSLPELADGAPEIQAAPGSEFALPGALGESAQLGEPDRELPEVVAEDPLDFRLDLSAFDEPGTTTSAAPSEHDTDAAAEPVLSPEGFPSPDIVEVIDFELDDLAAAQSVVSEEADARSLATEGEPLQTLAEDVVPADLEAAPVDVPPQAFEAPSTRETAEEDQVKVVGHLRIGIPLFNIYLNEADELSRRLTTEVAEWAMELQRPVGENAIALAHSLAGSSATVGFADLSQLARSLEHALMRAEAIGYGTVEEGRLFVDTAEEIRRLLHQFAAGFLKEPAADLLHRLAEHELSSARRLEAASAESQPLGDTAHAALDALDLTGQQLPVGDESLGEEGLLPADEAVDFVIDALPLEMLDVSQPSAQTQPEPEPAAQYETAPQPDVEPELEPIAEAGQVSIHEIESALIAEVSSITPSDEAQPEPQMEEGGEPPLVNTPVAQAGEDATAPGLRTAATNDFSGLGAAELKPFTALSAQPARVAAPQPHVSGGIDDDIDAVDAVDADLFPIFEEEAQDLLPTLDSQLRDWTRHPSDTTLASACMRTLHTLKGGARLAGAMRLGEMAHRLESAIEELLRGESAPEVDDVEALYQRADALSQVFDALRLRDAAVYAEAIASAEERSSQVDDVVSSAGDAAGAAVDPLIGNTDARAPAEAHSPVERPVVDMGSKAPALAVQPPVADPETSALVPLRLPEIDWSRFTGQAAAPQQATERAAASQSAVRVRAPLLDRLVNHAGEVSITRSRIEVEVQQIKGSLADLTDNLERLRQHLRDIELQAETQMSSRLEAAKAAAQAFDPLEFDRFTRFQELTRMMAESVNDVATVQRTLQRTLESTEDELAAQARLTRELQDDLLRTRMVEFDGLSDRLYRVVRQAAKETGKQVRLDIVGGSIEVDRGVLDRMTGAFEHLLRNSVTHGIESPDARIASGKDAAGSIVVSLSQEGNEVGVEFRDDGAGIDLTRVHHKGVAMGLLEAGRSYSDGELANLIFTPGFSTAEKVTELAGRGIGMDVVRAEVNAMGGRIETATAAGQGTSFKLVLPLTTAVTQVVMVRVGDTTVAVPSTLVEIVRRASTAEVQRAYEAGQFMVGDRALPFFWLGALLQSSSRSTEAAAQRAGQVMIIRSAQQRIAVHVDEVLGNQEVVVKNLGPQLSRMPGLAGMTLLASGAVALIYNPVALATLYGAQARAAMVASASAPVAEAMKSDKEAEAARGQAPLVMVVDDSLTVRRVTQRLLAREGYRVVLAKDGLDALERLAEEKPAIVLSDIEMPRMDGFDLVRNIRSDARLRELPVIMITSRIAQKHRDYAAELGVDHYLGKPYSEEDLLALISRYTSEAAVTA
jgi:chemosensory pili system protein ChpA (sensor histidine kinase/response regulator)